MTVIEFGPHAADALVQRGISREWVERAILSPDAVEPDPEHRDRTRYYRTIAERDGRVLRVVCVTLGGHSRVVTAFFDRARRR